MRTLFLMMLLLFAGCLKSNSANNFDSLRSLVIAGKFDQAIPKLETFATENPNSVDASRAGLFLFKANFAKGDFVEARKWCDWTIRNYSTSLEARKCKYKLAIIMLADGKIDEAAKQFERLARDASGPYTAEAVGMKRFLENHSIEPN